MASAEIAVEPAEWTVVDLAHRFGSLPARRVRTNPPPGTATKEDMQRVRLENGRLCEIIDGTLVEKAAGAFCRGTELFWVVDPAARTVAVFTTAETPDRTLAATDTLDGSSVLPGFSRSLKDLFEAADLAGRSQID